MARQPKKTTATLFNKYGRRGAFLLIDALETQLREDADFLNVAVSQERADLVEIYKERQQIGAEILAECNRAIAP